MAKSSETSIDKYNALFATTLRDFMMKSPKTGEPVTQKELAAKLGISPTTLAGYENAGKDPKIATLIKLADFYGVSVDNLVREPPKNLKEALKLRDNLIEIALKCYEQFEKTDEPVHVKFELTAKNAQNLDVSQGETTNEPKED